MVPLCQLPPCTPLCCPILAPSYVVDSLGTSVSNTRLCIFLFFLYYFSYIYISFRIITLQGVTTTGTGGKL